MASPTASGAAAAAEPAEGPVLGVVSKLLRQQHEKQDRIKQIESLAAGGEELNQEEKELISSKSIVDALINDLNSMRPRIASALAAEHSIRDREERSIRDLLELLYFGSLFDVQKHSEFEARMLVPKHERSCCLSSLAPGQLLESELDSICTLSSLLVAPSCTVPPVSHRDALEACARRVHLWRSRVNEPIHPGSSITYASVQDILRRIMASEYCTANPSTRMGADGMHDSPVPEESPTAVVGQEISTYGAIVRDLPDNVMPSQVARLLKRFGDVKQNSIRVKAKDNLCCAYIEFEHLSGLQCAIEGSPINVDNHACYVEEATSDYWETFMEIKENITKMVILGKKKHSRQLQKVQKQRLLEGQANGGSASSLQQQQTPPLQSSPHCRPASSLQKQQTQPPQSSLNWRPASSLQKQQTPHLQSSLNTSLNSVPAQSSRICTLNSPLPHQTPTPAARGLHCRSSGPSNTPHRPTAGQGCRRQSFGQVSSLPQVGVPAASRLRRQSFGQTSSLPQSSVTAAGHPRRRSFGPC